MDLFVWISDFFRVSDFGFQSLSVLPVLFDQSTLLRASFDCMDATRNADISGESIAAGAACLLLGCRRCEDAAMKTSSILANLVLASVICCQCGAARANDCPTACQPCKSWCPNDYQCKPMPNCPQALCFGLCDDYQCKPLPKCPCVPAYLGCDDYRCKPLPKCPSLCFPLWYTCGSCQSSNLACGPK